MANFISQTIYEVPASKAFALFANATSIKVEGAVFKAFSLQQVDGRTQFSLVLDVEGEDKTITEPLFLFDSTSNAFYITYNDANYAFTFFGQTKVNFCTIKNLL